jgi:hypothetical protein
MRNLLLICTVYVSILPIFSISEPQVQASSESIIIYVAPDGDDSNSGNIDTPLQTFKGARNRVRSLRADYKDIFVYFREGTYIFDETVVLSVEDSGTHEQHITYAAYEHETPIFTSLIPITNWTPYQNNIVQAPLPNGLNQIRFLYDKSENWMERSATQPFTTYEPAGGEDDGCIECNNYTLSTQNDMSNMSYPENLNVINWDHASQYDLRVQILAWHMDVLPIASVIPTHNRLFTAIPGLYDLRRDRNDEATEPRAWLLNTIEGIDEPGEWASLNGQIYLYPSSGIDDIFVPTLTELIRIDDGTVNGNSDNISPISHITFDGITFTGADFRIIQHDDVTSQHDWMVIDEPDALLRIRNADHILITNCIFTKSGGTGIRVDRYGQNIRLLNNSLTYLGRNGIGLLGRGPGYGDVNKNNEIAFNQLEYIGMEQWASPAILLDQSSNNEVHHNYIANTYFTGIVVTGTRQLALAAWVEGADDFYVGREFRFYEVAPSVITFAEENGGILLGSQEAMRFVYNYNNIIEQNIFVDVSTEAFINGQIYISGLQRSLSPDNLRMNYVEFNYFYDSFNQFNDYAIFSDSDKDATEYIGNMIIGIQNEDDDPVPLPIIIAANYWAETETEGMGQIELIGNISENVTFCNDDECTHTIGTDYIEEGQIINGTGGSQEYLWLYEDMYATLCDEQYPQVSDIPGSDIMRYRLSVVIEKFNGTILECEVMLED